MSYVYQGAVNLLLEIDMQEDVSGASGCTLYVKKPKYKELVQWTPDYIIGDSIYYVTTAGDLDTAGLYTIQPYFTLYGWTGYGKRVGFYVRRQIRIF